MKTKTAQLMICNPTTPDCPSIRLPVCQTVLLSADCQTVSVPSVKLSVCQTVLLSHLSDYLAVSSVRLSGCPFCQTIRLSVPSVRLPCQLSGFPTARLPNFHTIRLPAWSLVWLSGCLLSLVSSSNSVMIILWSDSVNSLGHS